MSSLPAEPRFVRVTRGLSGLLDGSTTAERFSAAEVVAALAQLASLQAALVARLSSAQIAEPGGGEADQDRLLTAEQVAERFNRSVAWVYRHAKHWTFTRRVTRRTLRFSESGLQRFLGQKRSLTP